MPSLVSKEKLKEISAQVKKDIESIDWNGAFVEGIDMAFDDFDTQIQSDEMIPEGYGEEIEQNSNAQDSPNNLGVCVYSVVSDLLKEMTGLSKEDRYELARAAEDAVKQTRSEQLNAL